MPGFVLDCLLIESVAIRFMTMPQTAVNKMFSYWCEVIALRFDGLFIAVEMAEKTGSLSVASCHVDALPG
jgi:hypothetical protein